MRLHTDFSGAWVCAAALALCSFGTLAQQAAPQPQWLIQPGVPPAAAPEPMRPAPPPAADIPFEAAEAVPAFRQNPAAVGILQAMQKKDFTTAYAQLAALEAQYAGDVEFDTLLGAAAVQAGAAEEAVLPLRRVVLQRPGALDVRFDLARALYAAGEWEEADRGFAELQKRNPPPAVARGIREYREAIAARNARYRSRLQWLAQVESGDDSNANAATDLQNFAGFQLSEAAREQSSAFWGLGLSAGIGLPLNARWRVQLEPQARLREYTDFEAASRQEAGLGAGLVYERASSQLRFGLRGTQIWLDGESNATLFALEGGWKRSLSGLLSLGANLRLGALRFPDALATREVDQYVLSTELGYGFAALPRVRLASTLLLGRDEAVEDDSPNSRDSYGFAQSLSWFIGKGSYASLRLGYLEAGYDDAFFGIQRDDEQLSAGLTLGYAPAALLGWGVMLRSSWLDNDSSVDFYSYDRVEIGLVVQREFQ